MLQRVAILGVSGRLGRAVVRQLGAERVHGLSRMASTLPLARVVAADRRDEAALRELLDGADAVVDLCGFDAADMAALGALAGPRPVVFASSLAERPYATWDDEGAVSDEPLDEYGQGKREAVAALQAAGVRTVSLRLPQLIALDDPSPRELTYLRDQQALGMALVPGTGQQLPALAGVDQVAGLIADLLTLPSWPEGLQVAHPHPQPLGVLVESLLRGADLPAVWQPHLSRTWRGPHSSGDERVDTRRLRTLLPSLAWPPLCDTYHALGRALALRNLATRSVSE